MSKDRRILNLLKSAKSEIEEFSARKYALLGATVTGLVFEWSPANEAVLGAVGISTHEQMGTGGALKDSVLNRLATGTITGFASFAEQAIVGSLTAVSLSEFPKTFNKWQESRPENSMQTVSKSGSIITALGLGSSMAVLEKQIIEKDTSKKDNIRLAIKTSAVVGGANALLATVASGTLDILDRNGQGETSDNIAELVKNPFLYIAIFGLAKAMHVAKTKNNNTNVKK